MSEPEPTPRAKSASLFDPTTKARANAIIGTIVAALVAAGWAKVEACQAKQSGETAAATAKVAKVVTDAAYEVTKEKVDPQGEALQKLRDDLNVLLAERQNAAKPGKTPVPAVPPTELAPAAIAPLPNNPSPDAGGKL